MMTDIEIKDMMYRFIKDSVLHSSISGELTKTVRYDNSNTEDIVISVNGNQRGQIQQAFVYVNVYVPKILRDGITYIEDVPRLRELCRIAEEYLKFGVIDDAKFYLDEQRVIDAETNESIITNKLLLKQCNE